MIYDYSQDFVHFCSFGKKQLALLICFAFLLAKSCSLSLCLYDDLVYCVFKIAITAVLMKRLYVGFHGDNVESHYRRLIVEP